MPLPHFSNVAVNGGAPYPSGTPQEVFYPNLYEVTFVLPQALQNQGYDQGGSPGQSLLLQQANKFSSGLALTEAIEVKDQRYKFSTRAFLATPTKTHVEFNIGFQVNVNIDGEIEVWNTLKAWYDLVWNSRDGSMSYKRDIVGTIILNMHDKKGFVLRRVTYNNVQIKSITNWSDPDWSSTEILSLQADFVADYWNDEYYDTKAAYTTSSDLPGALATDYPNP